MKKIILGICLVIGLFTLSGCSILEGSKMIVKYNETTIEMGKTTLKEMKAAGYQFDEELQGDLDGQKYVSSTISLNDIAIGGVDIGNWGSDAITVDESEILKIYFTNPAQFILNDVDYAKITADQAKEKLGSDATLVDAGAGKKNILCSDGSKYITLNYSPEGVLTYASVDTK